MPFACLAHDMKVSSLLETPLVLGQECSLKHQQGTGKLVQSFRKGEWLVRLQSNKVSKTCTVIPFKLESL